MDKIILAHSITEKQVLHFLLDHPEKVLDLKGNYFVSQEGKTLQQLLQEFYDRGVKFDNDTIIAEGVRRCQSIDHDLLDRIRQQEYDDGSFAHYYQLLKELYAKERIQTDLLENFEKGVFSKGKINTKEMTNILSQMQAYISLIENEEASDIKFIPELFNEYRNILAKRASGALRFTTGCPRLDDAIPTGFAPGEITTIFGSTGVGKSTFKGYLRNCLVNRGVPVLDISLEMSLATEMDRWMASRTDTPLVEFTGTARTTIDERIEHVVAEQEKLLSTRPKYGFMDVSKMSLIDLERSINKFKLTTKTDYAVVFVDLATMLTEFSGGDPKDYEKAINLTNEITKRTQVHMVLVVQAVQKTLENHRPTTLAGLKVFRPTLASIKNSGAIAERSRTVLSVYREKYYASRFFPDSVEADELEDLVEVQVLKYSNGAVGNIVRYGYDPAQLRLTPADVWRERKGDTLDEDDFPKQEPRSVFHEEAPTKHIGEKPAPVVQEPVKEVPVQEQPVTVSQEKTVDVVEGQTGAGLAGVYVPPAPKTDCQEQKNPTSEIGADQKSVENDKPAEVNTAMPVEEPKNAEDEKQLWMQAMAKALAEARAQAGNKPPVPPKPDRSLTVNVGLEGFSWTEETDSSKKRFVKFLTDPYKIPLKQFEEQVHVPFDPIVRSYINHYGVYIQDIVWTPDHIEQYMRTKEKYDYHGNLLKDGNGNKVLATLEEKTKLFSFEEFAAWIDDEKVKAMYLKMGSDYHMKVYEILHADEIAQQHPIPVQAPDKKPLVGVTVSEEKIGSLPVETKVENSSIKVENETSSIETKVNAESVQPKIPVENTSVVAKTEIESNPSISADAVPLEQEDENTGYTEPILLENIVPNPTKPNQKKPYFLNKILTSAEDVQYLVRRTAKYYNLPLSEDFVKTIYSDLDIWDELDWRGYLPPFWGDLELAERHPNDVTKNKFKGALYPVEDIIKDGITYRLLVKDKGWVTEKMTVHIPRQDRYDAWIKQHRIELPKVEEAAIPVQKGLPLTMGAYERYFLQYGERQNTGTQKLYFFTEDGKENYLAFERYIKKQEPEVPTDPKAFDEFATKFYKEFADHEYIRYNPETYEALKDNPSIDLDNPKVTIPDGQAYKKELERQAKWQAEHEARAKEKAAKEAAEKKRWFQELREKDEAEKAKPRHPDSLLTMEQYVAKYGAVDWTDPNLPAARLDEDYYFQPYDMLDKTQDKYYFWQFWFLDQNSIFYNENYRLHFDYPLFHKLFPHMAPYDYINIGGRYHVPRELKEVPGYTYGCFMGKLYQDLNEEQKKKARFYSKEYVRLVDLPSGKTICINDPFYFLPDERQRAAIKTYMSHYADNVPKDLIAEKEAFDRENNIVDTDWINGGKPEMVFCPLRIDKDDAFDKVRAEEKKRIIEEHALRGETITEADIPRVGSMVVELQDNSGQFVDLGDPFYCFTGSEKKFYQALHKRGQFRYMHEDLVKARKEFDKKHNIVNNTVYKDEPQYYD